MKTTAQASVPFPSRSAGPAAFSRSRRRGGAAALRPTHLTSLLTALAGLLAALLLAALPASAAQTHIFQETFGSAAQPSFSGAISVAVDQSSGDLLVVEAGPDRISRYHADGTPANFSALSATNFIDGKPGEADATPHGGLGFGEATYGQIAVDNSGTTTDGNIYVTQNMVDTAVQEIDIFSSSGEYLGQITGGGGTAFGENGGTIAPCGVAVDPAGNLYVGTGFKEDKIYKYAPSANPPSNADYLTTFAFDDPCQLAAGAGPSAGSLFVNEYIGGVSKLNAASGALDYMIYASGGNDYAKQISVNPGDGHLFVPIGPDASRIAEYEASSGGAELVSAFASDRIVASDAASGRIYVGGAQFFDVYGPLVPLPEAITEPASDIGETTATLNGTVKTFGGEVTECLFEFGPTAAYGDTLPCEETPAEIGTGIAPVHADLSGLAAETIYHYRLRAANVNGAAAPQGSDRTFQTVSRPEVLGSWSAGVTLTEATLMAQINPQGAATSYHFEWGLTEAPYEHQSAEVSIGSESIPHIVSLPLGGLSPGSTYHFRLVATNVCRPESEPGVLCTSDGPDRAFTTYLPFSTDTDCPNQAFRTGASAFLPDCRAYEMVSPVDKNGGDITRGKNFDADAGTYVQATPDGNALTYTTNAAFSDVATFRFNQYLAERTERGQPNEGWSSRGIGIPVAGQPVPGSGIDFGLGRLFMAFTPDLCSAWLIDYQTPPPVADGQKNWRNLYRRQNCGTDGELEALVPSTTSIPAGTDLNYVDKYAVQGYSADGTHAIFLAFAALTPEAAQNPSAGQLYDRFDGELHLVSVLPGGTPAPGGSLVGSGWGNGDLENAVSSDGSRVYWSSGSGLYLRLHPGQGVVDDECTDNENVACTVAVGGPGARFRAAAADGSAAIYVRAGDLYEFSLARDEAGEVPSRLLAADVEGVAGVAQDLSRVYFVSQGVIPDSGENSEGVEAVDGEPNLYLAEGNESSFVATLVAEDIQDFTNHPRAYNVIGNNPWERATRVSADGTRIAFNSRGTPTGYDNTDTASGDATVEVYIYDASAASGGGTLYCASCNPSHARPRGSREMTEPYFPRWETRDTGVLAAGWIPTWEHPLHASNVLSADGERLFFNSNDALLPRDANGAQDVYQWEAPGSGSCNAAPSNPSYFPSNGGCLYLISSGESPEESEFWEASADGKDVFFTTSSSLLPQDPGSVDLYDARVNGGFPQPVIAAPCEGEACQSPPLPPDDPTPASSVFRGAGNVKEPPRRKRCRKGKVRQRGRCVRKACRRDGGRNRARGKPRCAKPKSSSSPGHRTSRGSR